MVRGAEDLDGSLLAGSATLSGEEQLGIYRRQFELRIPAALAEDVPGLVALVGEAWPELADAYIAEHPPVGWSLEHLAHRMVEWLEARRVAPEWVEMARLDRAVQQSFFAAGGRVPEPTELAALPRLRLQAHVGLLRFDHSVHRWRSQALGGDPPDALKEGDFHVLVYRPERRVRHLECAPAMWRILDDLEGGIEAAIASSGADDPADIQAWFQTFVQRSLVELA